PRSPALAQPRCNRMPQRMHPRPPPHPITHPRVPITLPHQILQTTPLQRPPPTIHQQRIRPLHLHPEPLPPRHQIRLQQPLQRHLDGQHPPHTPPAQHPHTPLPSPPPDRRPRQRQHRQIPLRPRISRLTRPLRKRPQQLLRSVLTTQRLGGGGTHPRPRHRRHRVTFHHLLSHPELKEPVPRRPRPQHTRGSTLLGKIGKSRPQHHRVHIRQLHLLGLHPLGSGHTPQHRVQITPIGRHRVLRGLG